MTADDCGRKIKKQLESVGDEVVFETNIMKCETGETEMVGESEEYDMFGIEMVTHNLEEKYDIYQIKKEGVIDVYHEPKSVKCIEEIGEGPQNKFLDIQGEDMIHDSKPTTDSGNVFAKIEDETINEKKECLNEKKSSALCQKGFGTANNHIVKPFQCKICSKSFIWKSYLKIHEKTHTEEKSFQCQICLKSFGGRSNLKAHEKIHIGEKPFQCKICLKSFIQSSNLKSHERTHTGKKSFQCKICSKSFFQNSNLKSHERSHTGEKPFQCKICSKSFVHSANLKMHERTHTGEKPFQCKICLKSFVHSANLKMHERTHTGEKPFQCKICLKSFIQNGNLKTHEKTHTGKKNHSSVKFA
nr:zinc finger protein 69-like [Leptinotarsa decemlineata]